MTSSRVTPLSTKVVPMMEAHWPALTAPAARAEAYPSVEPPLTQVPVDSPSFSAAAWDTRAMGSPGLTMRGSLPTSSPSWAI